MKYNIYKAIIYFFISLVTVTIYKQISKNNSIATTINPNINGKDWLDEIFDMRQIITIPDRTKNVLKFCNSLNINTSIFNAILKQDLKYDNVYNLKIGEIACAL